METHLWTRTPYTMDVNDDEKALVLPCLSLMSPDAPQQVYGRREVFNALQRTVRAGALWRMLPTQLPALADGRLTDAPLAEGSQL